MRTTRIWAACAVVVIGGAVAWFWLSYPTYTYRFRLTVEVDVDGQTRSGSSVIEVQNKKQPRVFPDVPPVLPKAIGEAVFVDLGDGRNVIAVLAFSPDGRDDRIKTLVPRLFGASWQVEDIARLPSLRGSRDLTGGNIPTLVTFTDLNDPRTARVVRPGEFEQVFGAGIRFKRAFIEMTTDPVTRGIERRMPWLPHPTYLSGQFACGPAEPHCLHGGHLTR